MQSDIRSSVDRLVEQTSSDVGMPIERWPSTALERFTAQALQISTAHAYRSSFYRRKFDGISPPTTYTEFQQLPLTEPTEVKGRLRDLLAVPWAELVQINLSSGTTAGPTTYVAYTEEDLRGDGARYAPEGLFAFHPSDLVVVALPYDMATVGLSIHRDVQRQGAIALPAGKGGTYGPPERLIQAIHDLEATTLFSTPSYAWYLADLYSATFPGEIPPLWHLRVGGEGASPTMLARLGERWGADVRQWFGSTEIGVIAYSCERGVYHVTAGNCHLEVLDDAGKPIAAGTVGSIVLTTLGRAGTPFVRYRCGDRGVLPADQCGCGRTLPALRIFGRVTDQLTTPNGATSPYLVEEAFLQAVPEAAPWYHIALRDEGIALVAEWPGPDEPEERDRVAKEVHEHVARIAGLELVAVEWATPGTLDRPRTKMQRVKDERGSRS